MDWETKLTAEAYAYLTLIAAKDGYEPDDIGQVAIFSVILAAVSLAYEKGVEDGTDKEKPLPSKCKDFSFLNN